MIPIPRGSTQGDHTPPGALMRKFLHPLVKLQNYTETLRPYSAEVLWWAENLAYSLFSLRSPKRNTAERVMGPPLQTVALGLNLAPCELFSGYVCAPMLPLRAFSRRVSSKRSDA